MKINSLAAASFSSIGSGPELKMQVRKETLTLSNVMPETWKSISAQFKSNNANDEALAGADKQRSLVGQQKTLRSVQSKFEEVVAENPLTRAYATKTANSVLDAIRKGLDGKMKDLESQDKLGNFEIQDLMSSYNQAETLASSVLKKSDDTANSVIGKI